MGRRPILAEKKKVPSEYPQFTFRVSKPDKKELTKLIEAVQEARNLKRKESGAFINKNDVIVEALKLGLEIMIKSK
jgi:hypothetical protein